MVSEADRSRFFRLPDGRVARWRDPAEVDVLVDGSWVADNDLSVDDILRGADLDDSEIAALVASGMIALLDKRKQAKGAVVAEISKEQALEIARRHNDGKNIRLHYITDVRQDNWSLYGQEGMYDNCWFILWGFERPMLVSSRLICVCKSTGRVIFDGSACDEG